MVTQIEQMLVGAWKKFCDYYDTKATKYRESWPLELKEKDAKESHWVCWDENDLTFHIGRFFYDILKEKKEILFSNIEIHFEKMVNTKNFPYPDYKFSKNLECLKDKIKKKDGPKVDIIVADETSSGPFLLCAEVKHFHGQRLNGSPVKVINDDVEKLKALKYCKIAKRAVFILFDDYYWYKRGGETMKKIEDELDKIKKDENGITVLYYKSEAKMCGFRPDC